MPAPKEKRLNKITDLAIIAGGGDLPERLINACEGKGIEVFVVALEGQTNPNIVKNRNHMWARLGAMGTILKTLKAHEISDMVLIGSVRRPSLMELRPDLKTAEFFAKISLRALGDNDILGVVRKEVESEGFRIHGIHQFADDLLAPEGVIGKHKPKKEDWVDIVRGLEISQDLGALDVGQSVIVQEGIVLAVEAAEGTDELIVRSRHLKRKGRGGVLVKTCKPQQDRDFDLPTIGPETVRHAADIKLAGIVVHAEQSLIIDIEEVAELANRHKIFVIGVNPAKYLKDS